MSQQIQELQEFIYKMHGVQSMHIDSVRVTQILDDDTVWDGIIEVFEMNGHPKAPIVYAWAQNTRKPGKSKMVFAVLHLDQVDSPEAAVKTAMLQERRTHETA